MVHFNYPSHRTRAVLLPVLVIVGTAVLMGVIAPGVNVGAISRGVVGPTTWPKTMMWGVIACAVVLLVRNVLTGGLSRQRLGTQASISHDALRILNTAGSADSFEELPREVMPEEYDNRKAALGILVMLGYGAGIPTLGFGPATVIIVVLLLLIGGMRKPVIIGLVSVLGTAAMLYLFVKVTAMPLDRGVGYFNDINLVIYEILGIF
jgi:putative tricarboxylic transport membrane protein